MGIKSLIAFYNKQWRTIQMLGDPVILLLLNNLTDKTRAEIDKAKDIKKLQGKGVLSENESQARLLGVPLREYADRYMKDRVQPVMKRLAKLQPLDPDRDDRKVSLRARAEMEVRYQSHVDEIDNLKQDGVKLVICSVHADCSERCAPWQGKVYSLDGTTGTTDDGRKFVPLEIATQRNFTKKGVPNGLMGFNCFDDETEVYTSDGWIKFSDLSGEEQFYTLNTETREPEWQNAVDYYKADYKGDMIMFESTTTNLCVTPNHNMLCFTQRNRQLKFKFAKDCTTTTFFLAGHEWNAPDIKAVRLGGKEVNGDLYCKFLAYYLADGSIHSKTSIGIAQENNDEMFAELSELPFTVWHDKARIIIHDKLLTEEFARFGKCDTKHIPEIVKKMSRRQIKIFLDAFIHTDGYKSTPKELNGYLRKPHLTVFTTSKRMADDLSELALKAGYRPKIDRREPDGRELHFGNGIYKSKLTMYTIHLNSRCNITRYDKKTIEYDGKIYCVEVPNHTLLVKRKGRIMWCGNCRHYLIPYKSGFSFPKPNAAEERKEYAITLRQRQLERNVLTWRTKAIESVDKDEYKKAKQKAQFWNSVYIKYSHENGRAYYPSRTKIL